MVADTSEEAIALVIDALAVLRVFHRLRTLPSAAVGSFGLSGQLNVGAVIYLVDGVTLGHGFHNAGHLVGTTMGTADHDAWAESAAFQFAASLVGRRSLNEGPRRIRNGISMLSQSLTALTGSPVEYVSAVFALDALLADGRGAQTLAVARRVAYLSCGLPDGNMCGRTRETCSYLALEPGRKSKELQALRERSRIDTWWQCTEWLQTTDWYDRRGEYVHQGVVPAPAKGETSPGYWIYAWLLVPILDWLRQHQEHPIADLDAAIRDLPAAPDWNARRSGQLDAE